LEVTHSAAIAIMVVAMVLIAGCARGPGPRPEVEAPQQTVAPETNATPLPKTPEAIADARRVPPPVAKAPLAAAQKPPQASPPAAPRAPSPPAPPVVAPKPAALDLSSLEQRLRETRAIGALTKLALKNQVDDLLEQFRTYYQGKLDTDLAHLRRSYDLLVMKFLALLQDEDKPLANAIVASREEIWGFLSDRTKFATL
jgi:hypothetical protein